MYIFHGGGICGTIYMLSLEKVKNLLLPLGITPTDDQTEKLARYTQLLFSSTINVISRRAKDEEEVFIRHTADALTGLTALESIPFSNIADLGSGGGLPGIPLKIMRPEIELTVIDSNKKKTLFIDLAARELKLTGVSYINERFENIRKTFSAITVRAVAPGDYAPYILNMIRPGGHLVIWTTEDHKTLTEMLGNRFRVVDKVSSGNSKSVIVFQCFT